MDGKESNQGFLDLQTPMGMVLLVIAFVAVVILIFVGAHLFKMGFEKDREMRKELKRQSRPPAP